MWRYNEVIDPAHEFSRAVFSQCSKLVSHDPVCRWLLVATAFIKRKANQAMEGWDGVITSEEVGRLLQEVVAGVKKNSPVRGHWDVSGKEEWVLGRGQLIATRRRSRGWWLHCGGG